MFHSLLLLYQNGTTVCKNVNATTHAPTVITQDDLPAFDTASLHGQNGNGQNVKTTPLISSFGRAWQTGCGREMSRARDAHTANAGGQQEKLQEVTADSTMAGALDVSSVHHRLVKAPSCSEMAVMEPLMYLCLNLTSMIFPLLSLFY
jgi:hypothetical protein